MHTQVTEKYLWDNQSERSLAVRSLIERHNLAILLVRPEMFHHKDKIADFLQQNEFKVVAQIDRSISYEQYAFLYNNVFSISAAQPSLPTRTMVYVGPPCSLIIFKPNEKIEGALPDLFCRYYKGREGVPDKTTIRGGIVLKEALRLGFHLLQSQTIRIALDPIGALRNIVTLDGEHPHSHLPEKMRLLKYNAVSVHVPDSSEIVRDLSVLCSDSELKGVENDVRIK